MPDITHIFCDVGDVLIRSDANIAFEKMRNLFGLQVTQANRVLYANDSYDDFCRGKLSSKQYFKSIYNTMLQLKNDKKITEAAIRHILTVCINGINKEIVDYIQQLKRNNYTVVIVTDTNEWQSERFRDLLDIDNLGDNVFESNIIGMMKKDKNCFSFICHNLSIQPYQALLIDDDQKNNAVADKLGIIAPLFTTLEQFKIRLFELGIEL